MQPRPPNSAILDTAGRLPPKAPALPALFYARPGFVQRQASHPRPYYLCTLLVSCVCPVSFNLLLMHTWFAANCSINGSLKCEYGEVKFYPIDCARFHVGS